MKIKVDQFDSLLIPNSGEEFNQAWTSCLEDIYNNDRLIHHVDVDGDIFYSDYEIHIKRNVNHIKEIHIYTASRLESIDETKTTLIEYLTKFIPGMKEIANKLYGDVSAKTWEEFSVGLNGLQWIASSFEFLRILYTPESKERDVFQKYCAQLLQIVKELDIEMKMNNFVGIADLIQYELLSLLKEFITAESKVGS